MNEIILKTENSNYCKYGDLFLIDGESYIVSHGGCLKAITLINLKDGSLWDDIAFVYEDELEINKVIEYIQDDYNTNEISIEYLGSRKITIE